MIAAKSTVKFSYDFTSTVILATISNFASIVVRLRKNTFGRIWTENEVIFIIHSLHFKIRDFVIKLYIKICCCCLFAISRAAPSAYGGSPATGRIGAVAAGLHHSHGNARAASATYTTVQGNTGSLTHWTRPGIKPATSWFISTVP